MFEKFYNQPFWIKAEISALNLYPVSGHCFPLMVEKSEGRVKAQLKAIIWKEDLFYITQKFEKVTKEIFREGLNIMFLAYVKFSSSYGLSLQIVDIEPLYTLGEMAQDKINTILQLKKEGIFDKNRLLPLPLLLKNIAVISVETSKGYNDLMVTLKNNPQGYKVLTTLFPAILQGNGAVETMTAQLAAIRQDLTRFDAVVIVRGGAMMLVCPAMII
jgi:exodeoxyribonuclease VII large subunit